MTFRKTTLALALLLSLGLLAGAALAQAPAEEPVVAQEKTPAVEGDRGVACEDAEAALLPGEEEPLYVAECWQEYQWVITSSCGCGGWFLEKRQARICCPWSGCGGWSDTGQTRCTNYPCP